MLDSLDSKYCLVHGFSLDSAGLKLRNFRQRPSIVHYSKPMQYCTFSLHGLLCVVNGYGFVIVFQALTEATTVDEAQNIYDSTAFEDYYREFLNIIKIHLKQDIEDSEFSFLLVDSDTTTVSWAAVEAPFSDELSVTSLVESLFVFLLCNQVHLLLLQMPTHQSKLDYQIKLVRMVEDLFRFESPSQFLVNNLEINSMETYYSGWGIHNYVRMLRERFSQSITNITQFQGFKDRQRARITNTLLAVIAVLSLFQASDKLVESIAVVSETIIVSIILLLGGSLLLYALGSWLLYIALLIFTSIKERSIQKRVENLVNKNLCTGPKTHLSEDP